MTNNGNPRPGDLLRVNQSNIRIWVGHKSIWMDENDFLLVVGKVENRGTTESNVLILKSGEVGQVSSSFLLYFDVIEYDNEI